MHYIILMVLIGLVSACSYKPLDNIPLMNDVFNTSTKPVSKPRQNVYNTKPVIQRKKYKVALFLPLEANSVPIKKAALSLLNAARLAYKEVKNPYMELIIYPTDGTNNTIAPAAQRAVHDKIDLIIGPLLSPSVVAIRRYTEAAGIPMLAFSNDQKSVNGGLSYLLSYLPEQNVSNIVNYAIENGHSQFGIFASNTPYGKRISDIYQQEVNGRKGRVTNAVYFNENSADFYEKAKEISEIELRPSATQPTSWSAIMFADRASLMMQTVPLLTRYNVSFKNSLILGTGIWNDPRILEIEELDGAVFAAPNHKTIKIFQTRYAKMFQEKALTIASLSYDAVALASGLIKQYPNDAFSVKNITNPNGFTGVGGIFRFRNDGLSERGLSILQIKDRKFKVIIPAPDTFIGS